MNEASGATVVVAPIQPPAKSPAQRGSVVKRIKNYIQLVWDTLNGRKREIGAIAGPVVAWLVSERVVDQPTSVMVSAILTIWVAGAVVHGAIKKDL